MANLEPVEQFIKIKSCLDQKFIDNCPKFATIPFNPSNDFEDPLEFLRFLCLITKPITDKLNENGQVRKNPSECYSVSVCTSFECTKCNDKWQVEPEIELSVNLVVLLQKE